MAFYKANINNTSNNKSNPILKRKKLNIKEKCGDHII